MRTHRETLAQGRRGHRLAWNMRTGAPYVAPSENVAPSCTCAALPRSSEYGMQTMAVSSPKRPSSNPISAFCSPRVMNRTRLPFEPGIRAAARVPELLGLKEGELCRIHLKLW